MSVQRDDGATVLVVDQAGFRYQAKPWAQAPTRRDGRAHPPRPGAVVLADVDTASERALARGVPAAGTPVGLALLAAGCRDVHPWWSPDGSHRVVVVIGMVPAGPMEQRVAEGEVLASLGGFLARRQQHGLDDVDEARCRTAIRLLRDGRH